MFGKLKEKLSGWFGKKADKVSEKPKKKKEKKKAEKKEKGEAEKIIEEAEEEKEDVGEDIEEKLKEEAEKIKEEVPVKFEAGSVKYEPDLEAIEEKLKEKVPARPPKAELEKIIKEEKVEGGEVIEEKRGFFGKLAAKLTKSELKEKDFNSFFDEFEMTLLENNVALGVVDKIREELKGSLVGKQFGRKEVEGKILNALKGAIDSVLIEGEDVVKKIKEGKDPYVILFFGINGSGKTTSVAKLAWKLKKEGVSCVLAAADTFRAASIEQLEEHGKKIGVEVVKSDYGKDPASVAFDAIAYAKKHKKKVVLIDTAGRMYTKQNLMKEMEKIVKVSKPDLKIFVGESITGNDATEQAKMFNETAGIDGIILSKADVDEKAGTILSVSYVTGKPIFYLGVGQEYKDLKEFSKGDVLKGLGLD